MNKESMFWADQKAREVIEREERLNRGVNVYRCETGFGASGFPHMGSISDATRAHAVKLAIEDLGYKTELIAFSDDRDGLRNVPTGFPEELKKYLGRPVCDIPDPFGKCHGSFGEHMSSRMLDALDRFGFEYTFKSSAKTYSAGELDEQVEKIVENWKRVKEIDHELTGADRDEGWMPFLVVCEKCGGIYTTKCHDVDTKDHTVMYDCTGEFKAKDGTIVSGCGHKGVAKYKKGDGKLQWKSDFAARWAALKICFEGIGKDLIDSVKVSKQVCKEILDWEPPVEIVWEMYVERGGKKISKSKGNVITPQDWLKYCEPEVVKLPCLKRFIGTRTVCADEIPKYVEEMDGLAAIYYGASEAKNEKEREEATRLYEFCCNLKPEKTYVKNVPYPTLANMMASLPKDKREGVIMQILQRTGHMAANPTNEEESALRKRIASVNSWVENVMPKEAEAKVIIGEAEKKIILALLDEIASKDDPEEMQNAIFDAATKSGLKPAQFFKLMYQLILGVDRGPKLGPLIMLIGKENVRKKILEKIGG